MNAAQTEPQRPPDTRPRPPDTRPRPPVQRLGLAAVLLAVYGAAAGFVQNVAPEYQLKAAFVAKFPEFTEWPDAALDAHTNIEICVAAPSPFGSTLSDLVDGESIRGRPLKVRELTSAADMGSCLVLFVSGRSRLDRRLLLASAGKLPVLTVGESPTFLDEGGILNLRLVDGRVRFEVDVSAASRAGLRLSSQLLRLAVDVRGEPL